MNTPGTTQGERQPLLSLEEVSAWIMLTALVVISGWYLSYIVGAVDGTPVEEVDYLPSLVIAGVALVIVAVAGHIFARLAAPRNAGSTEGRARPLNLRAGYVGGLVLRIGAVGVLGLAVLESDHFWIAHAVLAVLVVSEAASSITGIVLVRRGAWTEASTSRSDART